MVVFRKLRRTAWYKSVHKTESVSVMCHAWWPAVSSTRWHQKQRIVVHRSLPPWNTWHAETGTGFLRSIFVWTVSVSSTWAAMAARRWPLVTETVRQAASQHGVGRDGQHTAVRKYTDRIITKFIRSEKAE